MTPGDLQSSIILSSASPASTTGRGCSSRQLWQSYMQAARSAHTAPALFWPTLVAGMDSVAQLHAAAVTLQ